MRTKNYEAILHKHIYSLLSAQLNVYDEVPDTVQFPFVRIGEPDAIGELTKNVGSNRIDFTIHVFSNYKGKKEVYNLVETVVNLLNSLEAVVNEVRVLVLGYDIIYQEEDEDVKHAIIKLHTQIYE
jgi:catalase (peroxidase I)